MSPLDEVNVLRSELLELVVVLSSRQRKVRCSLSCVTPSILGPRDGKAPAYGAECQPRTDVALQKSPNVSRSDAETTLSRLPVASPSARTRRARTTTLELGKEKHRMNRQIGRPHVTSAHTSYNTEKARRSLHTRWRNYLRRCLNVRSMSASYTCICLEHMSTNRQSLYEQYNKERLKQCMQTI